MIPERRAISEKFDFLVPFATIHTTTSSLIFIAERVSYLRTSHNFHFTCLASLPIHHDGSGAQEGEEEGRYAHERTNLLENKLTSGKQ